METFFAGMVGLLVLGLGFVGAYIAGLLGMWIERKAVMVPAFVSRGQVVWGLVALGFAAALGGGLFGVELATSPYVALLFG